jgi:hypothetical protein
MKKTTPAATPAAYVDALSGWQRATVHSLRAAVVASAKLDEVIKWGHLVYLSNGPVLLIRAEPHRVLLGFWRGQRLREIEGRLKPGGKYEMATVELHESDQVSPATVRRLVKAAVAFNKTLGDPVTAERSRAPARNAAASNSNPLRKIRAFRANRPPPQS